MFIYIYIKETNKVVCLLKWAGGSKKHLFQLNQNCSNFTYKYLTINLLFVFSVKFIQL